MTKKNKEKPFVASRVIVLTILLQIVLLKQGVKIVDQRTIPQQESVHYQVSAPTVAVFIKAHLNIAQIILKSCRNLERIVCFSLEMKLFSINCQSWKTAKSDFSEVVDSYGVDVLCLTETFESAREPVTFRKWSKISKPRKDGYGGVAILYKDDENGVIIERKQELELDTVEVIMF